MHAYKIEPLLVTSFMLIKVFSVLSMLLKLSKLPPGVCWRRGGGGNRLAK